MRKAWNICFKLSLPVVLSLLVAIACHRPIIQNPNISVAAPSNCRVVQHKLGTVCIPVNPQRIIALSPKYLVDPLLAIGVQPIGMAMSDHQGEEDLEGLTPNDIKAIQEVGDLYRPSLEKILKLKPDLILAMDFAHTAIYEQLGAIAPTVLVNQKEHFSFKKNLLYLAQLFDRTAEANRVLSQYEARLQQLRKQLNRKPEEIEVTVLIYYSGTFVITKPAHTSHEIFSDIGLINKINTDSNEAISIETLNHYDADVLFVMNYDGKPRSFFLENPLFASLNAVRNNQVYFVDTDKWGANGPLGVNRMLDDIFKYLPQN
jgi:iron complex transport system substrate-binding protein